MLDEHQGVDMASDQYEEWYQAQEFIIPVNQGAAHVKSALSLKRVNTNGLALSLEELKVQLEC